jgi:hypothetical protein
MTLRTNYNVSFEESEALRTALVTLEQQANLEFTPPVVELAQRVLAGFRHALYKEWLALPEGDHLKEAYQDLVWVLDDTDLAQMPAPVLQETEEQNNKGVTL